MAEVATDDHGCLVYAIVGTDDHHLTDMVGLDASPLRLVPLGPVAAVVNDIGLDRPPGRRADLLTYTEVIDALALDGPVVPVRFGSVLLDDASVVDEVLQGRERYFSEMLDGLRGRSQFHLHAGYHDGVALREIVLGDPDIAGLRERTRERAAEESHADRVRLGELVAHAMEDKRSSDLDALLEVVLPLAAAVETDLATDTDQLAKISLLVDDSRRGELETRLEELAEAVHERIRLSLVGPMPPYDFVGGAPWD